MNRIDKKFQELNKAGRKGLVGYLTAGDPDMKRSERNIRQALDAGVDILELGVPFSDPTADGPTIQAAALRALKNGMTVQKALGMVKRLRQNYGNPIVLFGYANPFFRYGHDRLSRDAAAAGVDGLLVVDLPFEESAELSQKLEKRNMHLIRLVAPTTTLGRAKVILKDAKGFVYYIMVKGVTGARKGVAGDAAAKIKALRRATRIPIAAGFGVSSGKQVREVSAMADAVVVGSALVKAAAEGSLVRLVKDLRKGLR